MTRSGEPPPAPSFGALFKSNLRVLLYAALLAGVSYGIWRGLRWTFPDAGWLQPK